MNGVMKKIQISNWLIINIPILLFGAGSIITGSIAFSLSGIPRIVALVLTWQLIAGAVMLSLDSRRKIDQFFRLSSLNKGKKSPCFPESMKHTLCGLLLIWAVTRNIGHTV